MHPVPDVADTWLFAPHIVPLKQQMAQMICDHAEKCKYCTHAVEMRGDGNGIKTRVYCSGCRKEIEAQVRLIAHAW